MALKQSTLWGQSARSDRPLHSRRNARRVRFPRHDIAGTQGEFGLAAQGFEGRLVLACRTECHVI